MLIGLVYFNNLKRGCIRPKRPKWDLQHGLVTKTNNQLSHKCMHDKNFSQVPQNTETWVSTDKEWTEKIQMSEWVYWFPCGTWLWCALRTVSGSEIYAVNLMENSCNEYQAHIAYVHYGFRTQEQGCSTINNCTIFWVVSKLGPSFCLGYFTFASKCNQIILLFFFYWIMDKQCMVQVW